MRGGKRTGAGRKPADHGETVTVRVPLACFPEIKKIVDRFKKSLQRNKT